MEANQTNESEIYRYFNNKCFSSGADPQKKWLLVICDWRFSIFQNSQSPITNHQSPLENSFCCESSRPRKTKN
jgi:hypothetical protein